jgi:acyl dehydratase
MASTTLDGIAGVKAAVGQALGVSDWILIDQDRINRFADVTEDHQWIHVDPERAKAESPWGTTIAHGYLTLSLTNKLLPEIVEVTGFSMGVNYGCGKVRFPAPVPVDSRVRATAQLLSAEDVPGGVQITVLATVEIEGGTKPACVVESISRYLT